MLKKILILFLLIITPVYAGLYEDAIKKSNMVLLYLYTPECGTCKNFDSIYNNVKSKKTGFAFVKVNANTPYGTSLMQKFHGYYVPYIVLTNSKANKSVNVNHRCAMNESCLQQALTKFKG